MHGDCAFYVVFGFHDKHLGIAVPPITRISMTSGNEPDGFEPSMQTRRNNCNRIFGGQEGEEEGRPPEGVSYRRTVVIDDRAKQWRYIGGRA